MKIKLKFKLFVFLVVPIMIFNSCHHCIPPDKNLINTSNVSSIFKFIPTYDALQIRHDIIRQTTRETVTSTDACGNTIMVDETKELPYNPIVFEFMEYFYIDLNDNIGVRLDKLLLLEKEFILAEYSNKNKVVYNHELWNGVYEIKKKNKKVFLKNEVVKNNDTIRLLNKKGKLVHSVSFNENNLVMLNRKNKVSEKIERINDTSFIDKNEKIHTITFSSSKIIYKNKFKIERDTLKNSLNIYLIKNLRKNKIVKLKEIYFIDNIIYLVSNNGCTEKLIFNANEIKIYNYKGDLSRRFQKYGLE